MDKTYRRCWNSTILNKSLRRMHHKNFTVDSEYEGILNNSFFVNIMHTSIQKYKVINIVIWTIFY